jgi:hypothetical protein
MIRKRNKLHKGAKQTGSDRLKKKWKQLGSDIKSEITSSHNTRVLLSLVGNLTICSMWWSFSISIKAWPPL